MLQNKIRKVWNVSLLTVENSFIEKPNKMASPAELHHLAQYKSSIKNVKLWNLKGARWIANLLGDIKADHRTHHRKFQTLKKRRDKSLLGESPSSLVIMANVSKLMRTERLYKVQRKKKLVSHFPLFQTLQVHLALVFYTVISSWSWFLCCLALENNIWSPTKVRL